jgi:hypothetical protein
VKDDEVDPKLARVHELLRAILPKDGVTPPSRSQSFRNLPREEWRPVADEPSWQVSNRGRVRRAASLGWPDRPGMPVAQRVSEGGQLRAAVAGKGRSVARLVAEAFLGPPPSPKHVACHIDGDALNNRASNLEWRPNGSWLPGQQVDS